MVHIMCDGMGWDGLGSSIIGCIKSIKEEADNKRIIANRLLETIEREKFREDEESTK